MDISKFGKYKNVTYVLFFAVCLFLLGQISFSFIRNSDSSVNSFIALSMVRDGFGLSDWFLCSCSFYFTDLIFHGFVALFTSNLQTIAALSPLFIVGIIFVCSCKVYEKIAPNFGVSLWLFLLMFVFFLHCINYRFLNSPNHTGTVSFCLVALLAFYNDNPRYKILSKVIFTLFAAMAVESDKYAVFYLILPLLSQTVVSWWQTKKFDLNILLLFPVAILMFLYHLTVEYVVPGIGQQQFVEAEQLSSHIYYWFFGFFKIFNAWIWGEPIALKTIPILLRAVFLAAILSSYGLAVYKFKLSNKWVNFLFFSSFFISCGFVFSDIGNSFEIGRYLIPVLFNGTILLAVIISSIQLKYKKIISVICATATLLLLFYDVKIYKTEYRNFIENHPVIDLIKQENLKSGYAGYFVTYSNGILFPDVQILPIEFGNKRIFSHLWLAPKKYTEKANFVLISSDTRHGITKENVEFVFGKPQKIITKGDYTILKYDYDLSARVNENLFYGRELPNGIEVVENADKSVTNKTTSKSGFLTYGPYVSKPKGTYEIVINYQLSDDGKAWFDVVANKGKKSFVKKDLLPENNQISETLVFDKDVNALEIRTYYQGSGYLTVKSIEVKQK